jgi:acetyl esterase/lipase
MKRILQSTLAIALISLGFTSSAQTRYLDDVFSAVTVTSDIDYATNTSILPMLQGLPPGPATLKCDIYEPTGDSVINRPVIILVHTGSFLPPVLNGQPTGSKGDLSVVEQCTRWAKKGYVAIAMDNRLGWNPTSPDQDVRTSSLLQAAYRGIQDAKAMVRYMRMTEDNGNPHGINPDKIILGGQGTGAYISLGYATLDDPATELMLPKFINFSTTPPSPYVYPPFFGNPDGTDSAWLPAAASPTGQDELWNIPNNPTYSNDVNMVFNLGGALADISWLQTGDVPMVSFHCEMDPYGPIDTGDVIVPTTGDFVVEVMGSRTVQHYANQYLNNDPFALAGISDIYTTAANVNNGGLEGLYVFKTPAPSTAPNAFGELEEEQGSPWDWWDNASYDVMFQAVNGAPAGYGAANSLLGNPSMSSANGNAYLDTVQGYLNPRMYEVLDLVNNTNILGIYGCTDVNACNYDSTANTDDGSCLFGTSGCTDAIACNYDASATCDDGSCDLPNGCGDPLYVEYDASVTCSDANACITLIPTGINEVIDASTDIYPNPANNSLNIVSNFIDINTISIYNLHGQEVLNTTVNANQIKINTSSLANGIYIIDIKSNNTSVKRKLIIE